MMNSNIYLLSFCVSSITFACLRAETCPFGLPYITNGVNAELIRNDTGLLLGIRVSWSWLSNVSVDCFQSAVVELSLSSGHPAENIYVTIGSRNNSVDFFNLDCNQMYTPKVRAYYNYVQLSDTGNTVFFGDSEISPPSLLPRVCVGPSTLPEHRGRVNISWELLPCHLQNGADIFGYTILYTPMSSGATERFSSTSTKVECRQEFGDLYSCVVANLLIPNNQAFSIQVAARSGFDDGPFSDPINILSAPVSNTSCTIPSDTVTAVTQSTAITTTSIALQGTDHSTSTVAYSQTEASSNTIAMTALIKSTVSYQQVSVWTLMGSLVAVIATTAGIVIVVQFIIIYALWKRLRSLKNDKAPQQKSTLCDKIDMKECSAYGQVISPQTVAEQPHIYESAT